MIFLRGMRFRIRMRRGRMSWWSALRRSMVAIPSSCNFSFADKPSMILIGIMRFLFSCDICELLDGCRHDTKKAPVPTRDGSTVIPPNFTVFSRKQPLQVRRPWGHQYHSTITGTTGRPDYSARLLRVHLLQRFLCSLAPDRSSL